MLHAQKPVFATAIALFVSLTVFGSAKPELVFSPKPETFAPAEKPWPASSLQTSDNSHLNNTDARIMLRLELEALKKALLAREPVAIRRHLTNALIFRKNRYQLYPDAITAENDAEMKQGMEAYNQLEESKKKTHEILPHFVASLNSFIADGNYQNFAGQTVPMYGYLLRQADKNWTKDVKTLTNFADLVIAKLELRIPKDVKTTAKRLERSYDGPAITAHETARTPAGK